LLNVDPKPSCFDSTGFGRIGGGGCGGGERGTEQSLYLKEENRGGEAAAPLVNSSVS
jgi:hypothetical protein